VESINLFVESLPKKKESSKKKVWKERMENFENVWKEERQNVLNDLISNQNISGKCLVCSQQKAVISCMECVRHNLCSLCDIEMHDDQPLHDRCYYGDGYKRPLGPLECIDEQGNIVTTGRN
jgi:translation initiation factor 2B subunit (eIF-2B alpha/beta/delta family)